MTRAEQRKRYREVYREQTAQERYWQPRIKKALDRMLVPVYRSLREFGVTITLQNLNSLILPGSFGDVIERLYIRAGTVAANSEYGFIMDFYGEELRQQKAFGFNRYFANVLRNFFSLFGGEHIQSITQTEHDRVRRILEQAADEGLNNDQIARLLRSEDINVARSKVVARTETATAMNKGSFEGAKRTGIVLDKVWIATLDDRTRRMPRNSANHLIMNNVKVPFESFFQVPGKTGISLMQHPCAPGAPPGQTISCRCRAISQARRDQSGRLIRVPVS